VAEPKPKRGRISSLETLPRWCDDAKFEAFNALKQRELTALEILDNFNNAIRLAAFANGVTGDDVPQISRSAFNRESLKQALNARRLEESANAVRVLGPQMVNSNDELTRLNIELLKSLYYEIISNAGDLPADGESARILSAISRGLLTLVRAGQITKAEAEAEEEKNKAQAADVIDSAAKAQGLTAETVKAIIEKILGVKIGQPANG